MSLSDVHFADEMARTLALLDQLNNRHKESQNLEYAKGYHQALCDFGAAYGLVEIEIAFLSTRREIDT